MRPQVDRTSEVEVLVGMESASRNRKELRPSDGRWRAPGGERPVRRMTNSIRSVVVASLPLNGEAQQTPSGTLPEWVQHFFGKGLRRYAQGSNRIQPWDGDGWLETEWPEGSGHEVERPAGRQTRVRQESEEPYER